jgi:outer membrane protein assembly factor BamB
MMLQVTKDGESFTVKSLYTLTPRDGLACEQQTPILYRGHLFGILPKDAGALRNQFACFHPDGRVIWSSGKTRRYGLGSFIIVDDKILIMNDDGVLTFIEASLTSFEELARTDVLDGRDAWGPMAFTNGLLLVRDSRRLVCLDLRNP